VLPTKVETVCRVHGFAAKNETIYTRKVYDLVLLWTELHWVKTQIHTVADHIDYFVIMESTTMTSQPSIAADVRDTTSARHPSADAMIITRVCDLCVDLDAGTYSVMQLST
jgi:hypothetical protein